MAEQLKLTGMVISSMPIGEFDKRLVLMTKQRGKITAFSRGCRRPKSTLLGATEPFVFGDFFLVPGKDAYTLVGAEVSNYFMELRDDLESACYGFYFLEFVSYFGRENLDGTQLLKLLYQSLRVLCKNIIPKRLVRRVFELKILTIEGIYPQTFSCVQCQSKDHLNYFSFAQSGVVCHLCKSRVSGIRQLHPSTVYTMQYIITSSIEKLYSFNVKEDVLIDLENVMDHYLKLHIDRRFKTLEMLELMTI